MIDDAGKDEPQFNRLPEVTLFPCSLQDSL